MRSFWKSSLLAAIAIVAGSFTLNGNECCYEKCGYFDGFYIGAAGGVASNIADTKLDTSADGELVFFDILVSQDRTAKCKLTELRPWGELLAGWGRECGCFYYGARFGINFSDFSPKATFTTSDASIFEEGEQILSSVRIEDVEFEMRTTEYTLDFKPGFIFCDRTMLYGLFGAAFYKGHLRGKSTLTFNTEENTLSIDKRETSTGFRGGIGVEHMITRCISLHLNYVYTCYGRLSQQKTFEGGNGINSNSIELSSEASKQVTSLGLAYYF